MAVDKLFYDEFDEICLECGETNFKASNIPGLCFACQRELVYSKSSSEKKDSEYTTWSS